MVDLARQMVSFKPATMRYRGLVTISVLLGLCIPAWGQTPSDAPVSSSNVVAGSVTGAVTDFFEGRGVVGPYMLSWKNIDAGSEHVTRDAQVLQRGDDYVLDAANGVLIFTSPLKVGESATVDYTVTPGKSTSNAPAAAAPVQLNVFSPGGGFTLNALVRPGTGTLIGSDAMAPGALMLAMGGTAGKVATGAFVSKLYLDASGGNMLDRSGVLLRETKTSKSADFTLGYSRAGMDFSPGTDASLAAGKEIMDASATLHGSRGLTALASMNRTANLASNANGATLTTYTEQLTAAPNAASNFQATNTTSVASADGTGDTVTDMTHMQLNQKVSKVATLAAVFDRQQVDAPTTSTATQSATVTMTAQPTAGVSVQGMVANRLLATGRENEASLQVNAKVTPQVSLTASSDDRAGQATYTHTHALTTEYVPSKTMTLTGGVAQQNYSGTDAVVGTISADAHPATWSEVSGTVRLRDPMKTGGPSEVMAADTYRGGVTLMVGKGGLAKFTGAYALNPDDALGVPTRGETGTVGLTAKAGQIAATGTYSTTVNDVANTRNDDLGVGLGWTLGKTTQLSTNYQTTLARTTNALATDTYSLNLTHSIASLLDFTLGGSMTTQEQNGLVLPNHVYSVNAQFGLRF